MYKAYQSSFNIEKYFIFLKTTHTHLNEKGVRKYPIGLKN